MTTRSRTSTSKEKRKNTGKKTKEIVEETTKKEKSMRLPIQKLNSMKNLLKRDNKICEKQYKVRTNQND